MRKNPLCESLLLRNLFSERVQKHRITDGESEIFRTLVSWAAILELTLIVE